MSLVCLLPPLASGRPFPTGAPECIVKARIRLFHSLLHHPMAPEANPNNKPLFTSSPPGAPYLLPESFLASPHPSPGSSNTDRASDQSPLVQHPVPHCPSFCLFVFLARITSKPGVLYMCVSSVCLPPWNRSSVNRGVVFVRHLQQCLAWQRPSVYLSSCGGTGQCLILPWS